MILSQEFVRQRGLNDCGVACLAMAARVEYESAKTAFDALGLGEKSSHAYGSGNGSFEYNQKTQKSFKRPAYSSNFHELSGALLTFGLKTKLKRFTGWNNVRKPAIIKVSNGHKTNWHWVYARRNKSGELYVFDPAHDLLSMKPEQAKIICLHLDLQEPRGYFIEIEA